MTKIRATRISSVTVINNATRYTSIIPMKDELQDLYNIRVTFPNSLVWGKSRNGNPYFQEPGTYIGWTLEKADEDKYWAFHIKVFGARSKKQFALVKRSKFNLKSKAKAKSKKWFEQWAKQKITKSKEKEKKNLMAETTQT